MTMKFSIVGIVSLFFILTVVVAPVSARAQVTHVSQPYTNNLPKGMVFQYEISEAQTSMQAGTSHFLNCNFGSGDTCSTNVYATSGYWSFAGWTKGGSKTLSCQPARVHMPEVVSPSGFLVHDPYILDEGLCAVCAGTSCTFLNGVTVAKKAPVDTTPPPKPTPAPTAPTPAPTPAQATYGAGTPANDGTCTTGNCGGDGKPGLVNLLTVDSLQDLIALILKAVVQIGTIILVLMLMYVGFMFVQAQGNEEKITSARSALTWTILGGLLLLGAQALSLAIQSTIQTL